MTDVPQVAVAAVAVFCIKRQVNAMLFAVFNLVFTGLHGPDICHTPRRDDLDIRRKRLDAQLETDLVISFSGCSVTDGDSAFLPRNFHQFFRNSRTRHGSSQEILVFIDSACLHTGHNEIISEFIYDIFNI